jgi:transcriptional regulator with XRE-family HTH domain
MAKYKRVITPDDREFVTDVSKRLRSLRHEQGFTILELAEKANVPFNTVARYERGNPTFSQLRYFCDLARVFGVSLDYLAGLEEE